MGEGNEGPLTPLSLAVPGYGVEDLWEDLWEESPEGQDPGSLLSVRKEGTRWVPCMRGKIQEVASLL